MFRLNKKNLLNLEYLNNTSLLTSSSKEENNKFKKKKIKKKLILEIKKDINGMEITYGVIKKFI